MKIASMVILAIWLIMIINVKTEDKISQILVILLALSLLVPFLYIAGV
jgi:hypothetical protein